MLGLNDGRKDSVFSTCFVTFVMPLEFEGHQSTAATKSLSQDGLVTILVLLLAGRLEVGDDFVGEVVTGDCCKVI